MGKGVAHVFIIRNRCHARGRRYSSLLSSQSHFLFSFVSFKCSDPLLCYVFDTTVHRAVQWVFIIPLS